MATTQRNQSTFDFTAYNGLLKQANSGLQLYLAIQMLQTVESVMRRFDSPFAKEMIDIVDELSDLRERNKKFLLNRERSGNTEHVDDAHLNTQASNSGDTDVNPT